MNAPKFAQHSRGIAPQVRWHAQAVGKRRRLAVFDQAVDPHAVLKINGVEIAGASRQQMHVVTARGKSAGKIAGQAAYAADDSGWILLAQQANRKFLGRRQKNWATLERAFVWFIKNVDGNRSPQTLCRFGMQQAARLVQSQMHPFRRGGVEIQIKLVANRGIQLSLRDIKIHVVEGVPAECCPVFQDRGEVSRLGRRVFQREINPVSNDGQVVGVDALLIADVTGQIAVVDVRVGNLLQLVEFVFESFI
jgi:hypothetical protein